MNHTHDIILFNDYGIKVTGDINQPWALRDGRFVLTQVIGGEIVIDQFARLDNLSTVLTTALLAQGLTVNEARNICEDVAQDWIDRTTPRSFHAGVCNPCNVSPAPAPGGDFLAALFKGTN
jgi:hypothetical protein